MRILQRVLAAILVLVVVGAIGAWLLLFRPVAQAGTNDPVRLFNHGSIGNEEQQGIPYWIWRVLPQVFPEHLPNRGDGYGAFGVHWEPGSELPVGFGQMTLGVIPRVAPNCAFCHQSTYRLAPESPATLVTAGAGARIEVQGFIRFLAAVGQDPRFTAAEIMPAIDRIADLPAWERALYRFVLIPATRAALSEQAGRFAWMRSRPDWGPGRIDPFNPVKFHNLGMADDGSIGNSDMMPLWLLDFPERDGQPADLHWDGLLTDLHETAVAGAIGDGLIRRAYPAVDEDLRRVTDFIRVQGPPRSPFSPHRAAGDPFHVDAAAVDRGRAVYRRDCAACHERDGALYRMTVPAEEIGTDRHRLGMWSRDAADRYTRYDAAAWGFTAFDKKDGYVNVGLDGLWLRGPYLHNGSVPTLAALLAPPEERPVTFRRGGDLLDPAAGGFVSDGPHAGPFLFDTRLPGNGNGGHLWGTALPQDEKDALLAYLKTL